MAPRLHLRVTQPLRQMQHTIPNLELNFVRPPAWRPLQRLRVPYPYLSLLTCATLAA